jgi:hypothetical protein
MVVRVNGRCPQCWYAEGSEQPGTSERFSLLDDVDWLSWIAVISPATVLAVVGILVDSPIMIGLAVLVVTLRVGAEILPWDWW